MRKLLILALILALLTQPVLAQDYTAPEAPDAALELMPRESSGFAQDLWTVVTGAMEHLQPALYEALKVCLSVFASAMLIGMVKTFPGAQARTVELVGVLAVAGLLLQQTHSLVSLASETVTELAEYSKLLLPVMTAALASQGGITSSTALYAGTAVFNALLSGGMTKLLLPLIYVFLALSVAAAATEQEMVKKLAEFGKWLLTWCLKLVLYLFTGYMGITGVISGTADAATVKAAKLTMSGMVPVVGGILSDASEAVVVGAGVVKNSVGVYGLVALIAIWISPFIRIGAQYLVMKLAAALGSIFDCKALGALVQSFCAVMGLLVAMTGTACVLLLISVVCFMKGMT